MRYVLRNPMDCYETKDYWLMSPDIYAAKKFWFKESAESYINIIPGIHWGLTIVHLSKMQTLCAIWSEVLRFIDKRL